MNFWKEMLASTLRGTLQNLYSAHVHDILSLFGLGVKPPVVEAEAAETVVRSYKRYQDSTPHLAEGFFVRLPWEPCRLPH